MKKCTKCHVEQPLDQFVKSDRYSDGKHPHCKTCRKGYNIKRLVKNSICSHCHERPHSVGSEWCILCQRLERGRSPEPKYKRDSSNKLCCCCKLNPRAKGKMYCPGCASEKMKAWVQSKGGWYKFLSPEQKKRAKVRAVVGKAISRGKMKRLPCEICGGEPSEFHHYAGYAKENTFVGAFLCAGKHHLEADRGIIKVDRDGDGRLVVTVGEAGIT